MIFCRLKAGLSVCHYKWNRDRSTKVDVNQTINNNHSSEIVVLLHGLASHRVVMRRLAVHLESEGYRTNNWGYFSLFDSIPKHGGRLLGLLEQLDQDDSIERIHFVTHSMGGIVVRYALSQKQISKASRFVMLTPPNHGSHVARIISRVTGPIWPAMLQLSDAEGSLVKQLPMPTGVEVGVVAASPDHVVRMHSTNLASQVDHIVERGPHRAVPLRASTHAVVASFLKHGQFRSD